MPNWGTRTSARGHVVAKQLPGTYSVNNVNWTYIVAMVTSFDVSGIIFTLEYYVSYEVPGVDFELNHNVVRNMLIFLVATINHYQD